MTRAFWLTLLLAASAGEAREKLRPKPSVSPVRQGTGQPAAPAPAPDRQAAPPAEDTDEKDQAPPLVKDPDDDDAPPGNLLDDDDDSKSTPQADDPFAPKTSKKKSKEDEDRDTALGFGIMCCCFLFFVGLIVLIVWLVRRGAKPKPPVTTVYPGQQTGGSAGPFHLSVAAIGLDARTRGTIEARFNALGGAGSAGAPPNKGAIARALAQALLEQKDHWRWFGYGEKPLMYAFGEADLSFRAATDDFKARSNTAASSPEGELVVYTLICCANRLLKGVTRLDSIAEAQEVFLERSRVQDHEVFGGEVVPSPLSGGMSETELTQRYPEMNRLVSAVG